MKKKTTSKPKSGFARGTASSSARTSPSKAAGAKPAKAAAKSKKPAKPSRPAPKKSAAAKPAAATGKSAPKGKAKSTSKASAKTSAKSSYKAASKTVSRPADRMASNAAARTASKSAAKSTAKPTGNNNNLKAKTVPAPRLKTKSSPVISRAPAVIPAPMEEPVLEPIKQAVPAEDEASLRNVMASLTSIFGGKDFLSDAELDDFLDSKIASGEIPPSAALDPLDEAQSLIYEAWNSEGPQRVRLAHRALETCADCADAYVILAEEEAKDRKHALELFRKGVEAGERSLDPGLFKDAAGKFWEIMETRPYMRARLGLAECLWEGGRKEEAVSHLRDLFRLNPSDNQGVRYILAQCLLETGAEGELGELLERFRGDTSPEIRYSHALWAFRREGPGRKASAILAEAVKANPHVPAYLLKRKPFPKAAPESIEAGSEEEAAAYAAGAAESWHNTLGALDWLSESTR